MLAKKIALGFGIAVMFPMMVHYGASSFNVESIGYSMLPLEVPVGILATIIGAFLSIESLGTGFIFGGIFCMTTVFWNYGSKLQDQTKFFSLLIGLVVLVVLGYKKIEKDLPVLRNK